MCEPEKCRLEAPIPSNKMKIHRKSVLVEQENPENGAPIESEIDQ